MVHIKNATFKIKTNEQNQAETLSFSVCLCVVGGVWLCTVARRAPLSVGFPRQEQ